MKIRRLLKYDQIKLELESVQDPNPPENADKKKYLWAGKEAILKELVELINTSGKISNPKRLFTDILNREKQFTTAIGEGIAVPHVRTVQAKEFVMGFGRSTRGVDFAAVDGKLVYLFFIMVAPPYDDRLYLRTYKYLAERLLYEDIRQEFLTASSPHEIIRIFSKSL